MDDLISFESPKTEKHPNLHTRESSDGFGDFESATHDDRSDFLKAAAPGAGPSSQRPSASSHAANQPDVPLMTSEDEAFFHSLEEKARREAERAPSPPMIDLRDIERKLDLARSKSEAIDHDILSPSRAKEANGHKQPPPPAPRIAEPDFFSAFAQDPRAELQRQQFKRRESTGLEGAALQDMAEAQSTPMEVPQRESRGWLDYLIGEDERLPSHPSAPQHKERQTTHAGSPDNGGTGRSWTDTAKKTWGTLRGLSGEVINHLPSAADLFVPPDDEEFQEYQEALARSPTSPKNAFPRSPPRRAETAPQPIPSEKHDTEKSSNNTSRSKSPSKRWLFAGGAPNASTGHLAASWHSGSSAGEGTHANPLGHAHPHGAAGAVPIAGAPGFDIHESRKWNTGHWKMEEEEKVRKYIPVDLVGRRDVTSEVIEPWHAARLQAALPPRLKLGKTWRLLYSLDQHGTSLGTLYHNVAKGLDPAQRANAGPSGGGLQDAEGWLRGASSATRDAMVGGVSRGSLSSHVGSGLSLPDAGLIIAVKDAEDNVFGAFVNEKLRPSPHYYGNGECFLWKTTADSSKDPNTDEAEHAHKRIKTYKWTAKNDYMVLTEAHFLSVGGGDGRYGLWIDDALENGVSSRCPAFDNDILCNDSSAKTSEDEKEGRFECLGLEVWAVGAD